MDSQGNYILARKNGKYKSCKAKHIVGEFSDMEASTAEQRENMEGDEVSHMMGMGLGQET